MVEIINEPQLNVKDLKVAGLLFYKKLLAVYNYNPSVFNGDILLIRAKDNFVDLDEDYGLSEVIITFKYANNK